MDLSFHPVHQAIGAEVKGLDMSQPLDTASAKELRKAWVHYKVLVVHNQPISDAQHVAFSQNFGDLGSSPEHNSGRRAAGDIQGLQR